MACSYPVSAGLVWLADYLTSREGNPDMVNKYRKKPVVIEAVQWDGTAAGANPIIDWVLSGDGMAHYRCDGPGGCPGTEGSHYLVIRTLEGDMLTNSGDYVIRGVQGEFYPCKPDIFEQTYEPAKGTPTW